MAFYRSIVLKMACILSYSRDHVEAIPYNNSFEVLPTAPRVKLDYKILIFFVKLNFSIS